MNRGLAYDPAIDTYGVATGPIAVAAAATDFFVLVGSPTKTVLISEYYIWGNQTTTGTVNVFSIKRSADNTGGTSANQTIVPFDSSNPASGATARIYTANPAALGAAVGTIHNDLLQVPSTGFPGIYIGGPYQRKSGEQDITLRGVNEIFALNLAGVTVAGGQFRVNIRWREF